MKKRILICGIKMNMGGTEKAFLSFLNTLDRKEYSIDLVLAEKSGVLLDQLPPDIRVLSLHNGVLFCWSRSNTFTVLRKLKFPGKYRFLLSTFPSLVLSFFQPKAFQELWIKYMNRIILPFEQEFPGNPPYDLCQSFWGDRTMFYMCEKVKAKKKITWLHFDYLHPKRNNRLYRHYFSECNAVISVSNSCTALLRKIFPEMTGKFFTLYNPLPIPEILRLSKEAPIFPDPEYDGIRVLSVMRICPQKGCDLIAPVLAELKKCGLNLRWYLAGNGSRKEVEKLKKSAKRHGVSDRLILLGSCQNPYPLMRHSDIFVLPSRFEGMPITVEEAKLLHCPILVTNYLSAKEQLCDGQYGMISPFSAKSLASALKNWILDAEKREEFRKKLSKVPIPLYSTAMEFHKILENC